MGRDQAQRVLEEDVAYLEGLLASGDAALPQGRRSGEQKRIHSENVERLSGSG
jgi:hypothetical protein